MVFLLQKIGVQLCLLPPFADVHTGALCLDHRKRPAVVAVKHIVREAHLAFIRHAKQFDLVLPILSLFPTRVGEHRVNIELARLVLRKLQRLRHIALLLLLSARGQLRFQRGIFGEQHGEVDFHLTRRILRHPLLKARAFGSRVPTRAFSLRRRCRRSRRMRCLQQLTIELPRLVVHRIAARNEVHEPEEVLKRKRRLLLGYLLARIRGSVRNAPDIVHACQKIAVHHAAEILGAHQSVQRVLIRRFERRVHRIHPLDGKLHRPAAADHARGAVYRIQPLRADRRFTESRKLRLGL